MPSRSPNRPTKKQALAEWLTSHPAAVSIHDWQDLLFLLSPISNTYLRNLLRNSQHPLDPLVEGVRQDSMEALERTLLALEGIYSNGEDAVKKQCRALVIEAKLHASFALKRTSSPDQLKRKEMIEWMQIWLENPGVFPLWVQIRKQNY